MRTRPVTKLGAIVNSTPWFVGAPSAGYTNVEYGGGYGTFRTSNSSRNAVFVAANDGMLHAFNGDTGNELFAYVPRALYTTSTSAPYSKLAAITAKDFSLGTGTDRMNADGSVMAADMKTGLTAATETWKTYLFGAFGRGAKGVYALDVSSPATVTESSTDAATLVKWEFTDAADSDMGYVLGRTNSRSNGQPTQTGKMANGKWAVIYGNGYNSASGNAALFILFADGPTSASSTTWTAGTHYKKIVVSASPVSGTVYPSTNGLAAPTAVDTNNDGIIDVIYAGDLQGNVWKFNVSDSDPANWGVATTGGVPSYRATTVVTTPTTTTYAQPITTAIVPFAHPQGGYQLFFGTGKVLESSDYPMTTPYSQTLYGIYDQPGISTTLTVGKTDLVQQTTTTSGGYRYFSNNTVSYPTQKGWYLDLPVSSENVIFNPIPEDAYRVNVRSLAPETASDGCRYDATAYDATINPVNGTPISNLIPGVPLLTGYGAVGQGTLNAFEFSRGGVFKAPTPPPSSTGASCTAGSANCVSPTTGLACTAGSTNCVSRPVCSAGESNCKDSTTGASCTSGATCLSPNDTPACTPGSLNCVCNPAASTQCVLCPDPLTCNPPWKPLPQNQCMYRTLTALGSGGIATSQRFGSCSDGRLTWREIFRNH
jgi:type IV pilus assembly protein PilY1